jgi:hypothetical protein
MKVLNGIFARRRWIEIYFSILEQDEKKLHSPLRSDKCPRKKTPYQILTTNTQNTMGGGKHASLLLDTRTFVLFSTL